jgi:uncharacterized membrane protein
MSDEMNEDQQTPQEPEEEQAVDLEGLTEAEVGEGAGKVAPAETEAEETSSEEALPDSGAEPTPAEVEPELESAEEEKPAPAVEPEAMAQETTEQDKLMAFLSYVIGFLVPGLVLLSVDMRERHYQRIHATQSLALWSASIVFYAVLAMAGFILMQIPCVGWLLACISLPLYLLPPILIFYYALLASQGREFEIPFLTDALRQQGWL